MKIFILASEFPPGPGGIGDHAFNLSEQLIESQHEVIVITELRKDFAGKWEGRQPRAQVKYFVREGFMSNLSFVRLFAVHFFGDPDAIWIATGSKSLFLVGLALTWFQRKSIAILHGHEMLENHGIKSRIARRSLHRFSRAIAVSEFSKANSQEFMAESRLVVIPNGFDPIKYGPLPAAVLRQPSRLNLLTLGRISKRKGQHNVVNALPLIAGKFPEVIYHVVGINDSAEHLREQTEALGVTDRVRIHGVVATNNLTQLFAETDIFIMLSENVEGGDVEGFGIAIIEANYFGIPAIGSRGTGIEQAIQDGFNGRLVSANNGEEIAQAIDDILTNYATYSDNARAWAAKHFWSVIKNQYIEVISTISKPTAAAEFFSTPLNYLRKDYNVLVRQEFVREFAGDIAGKSILDMGCGDGRISIPFAAKNQLTLVDGSPGMLEIAKTNTPPETRDQVTYVLSQLEGAPLSRDGYDLIIAMGILAHLESWKAGLKMLTHSLKPGGLLMVQISDGANWFVQRQLKPGGKRKHSLNRIEFDMLEDACAKLGLKKVNMKRYGFTVRGMGLLPNWFLYRFTLASARCRIFRKLATEVMVVFQKPLY